MSTKKANPFVVLKVISIVSLMTLFSLVSKIYINNWEQSLNTTLESFSKTLSHAVWTLNRELIEASIKNMIYVKDILEILVLDDKGEVLARVSHDKRSNTKLEKFFNLKKSVKRFLIYYKGFFAGQVYFRYYYYTATVFLLLLTVIFVSFMLSAYFAIDNLEKNRKLKNMLQELNDANTELELTLNELEATQQKVINSEKMAALGKLMVNIAHDVNTPTGVIYGSSTELLTRVEIIHEKYLNDELTEKDFEEFIATCRELLDIIVRNSEKIRELVQSLKRVAMQEVTQVYSTVKVKDLVDDVLRTMHPRLRKTKAQIHVNVPDNLTVRTIPGAWVQILMNLIDNSVVHGFEYDNPGNIYISFYEKNGKLVLEYRDDGKGMDKETKTRAFEPFFTTDSLHGTGLGLSIVHQLAVEVLHGDIELYSEPGKGVTIIVSAPLNHENP
ncbi:sensor histidine kinase [Fervidobacterium thailandense]|uniref:sensor histidine kinase n=1 Tax=Fervidobacterium thailandense TaxID=1008305 RepID=UPI000A9B4CAC|nr:HAMP domain-containing sensor histidine kinase [Fervidobacterium thailandense]